MSYTVYGLRLIGDKEARYIGQTGKPLDRRLAVHHAESKVQYIPSPLCVWLMENKPQVEAFPILTVATRTDAHRAEREAVEFCLALNHRLFNRCLVPRELRIPRSDELQRIAA